MGRIIKNFVHGLGVITFIGIIGMVLMALLFIGIMLLPLLIPLFIVLAIIFAFVILFLAIIGTIYHIGKGTE